MKRIKGVEEDSNSSSSKSPPEVCKKVRKQTSDESVAVVASESTESDWARLPQELLLHIFQYLPLLDRAYASQVCRTWNQAFHMPELWRCFEFELNQPASSYLKATHPDLIKQIIKRHSNHLQYVSFKVRVKKLLCLCWNMCPPDSGLKCLQYNLLAPPDLKNVVFMFLNWHSLFVCTCQVDSSTESAEAACDILSQLVNCSLKTLGLISTARPSFMEVPKVYIIINTRGQGQIYKKNQMNYCHYSLPFLFIIGYIDKAFTWWYL